MILAGAFLSDKKYIKIEDAESLKYAVKRAADVLNRGGVILYPTDTLYGLGIDVVNEKAVEKLYAIKGRSNHKPVSLMIADIERLKGMMNNFPVHLEPVFEKLFPGKITALIGNGLKENLAVFEYLQGPLDKIGFRIPRNAFCRLLSREIDNPVSTTSANISGMPDINRISDLPDRFKERVDLIIDSGEAEDGRGSTIIDFSEEPYKIVRRGAVSKGELENLLPRVRFV
jgi:L-threonylcarbamoyladenylate synthase